MADRVKKHIYRKVAIENSYTVEELSDGSKRIIFQPIIYISCENIKDLTIIEFDKPIEGITDNVSTTTVKDNNNLSDSLASAEKTLLNNDVAAIIANGLPEIIKDIEQNDLIKSATGRSYALNDYEGLQAQTINANQSIFEPQVEISETNFDDSKLNYLLRAPQKNSRQIKKTKSYKNFNNLIQRYCSKCKAVPISVSDDNCCCKCLSLLQFHCVKCFQWFESYDMVENHAMECEITTKPLKKKILTTHTQKCIPTKKVKTIFKCRLCKSRYFNKKSLSKHERVCRKKYTAQCEYCPFVAASYGCLLSHIHKLHQECLPDDYKCLDCGTKYKVVESFRRHFRRCTQKMCQCDHCTFRTTDKKRLAKHVQINHV